MKVILNAAAWLLLATASFAQPAKFHWNNATVYFLLNDRFFNGDTSIDQAYGGDPSHPMAFQGGDLRGITMKIQEGYFDSLGVNALWITAPYQQDPKPNGEYYAYHGYYGLDWTEMDPNMGAFADFQALVDSAHAHGIRIVIDVVMNHTGYGAGYDKGTWIREKAGDNDRTMILTGLPDVITENDHTDVPLPKVLLDKWDEEKEAAELASLDAFFKRTGYPKAPRYYFVKWIADWVRRFGVDGFRIDTAKHVDMSAWAALKKEAAMALKEWKKANPNKKIDDADFWMVGEVYGQGVEKNAYYTEGGFDAVLNFSFRYRLKGAGSLEGIYSDYASLMHTDTAFSVMNYISSHDVDLFDRERLYEGATALLLAPGAAQIYYGDETKRPYLDAEGDQRLRKFMNWESIDQDLRTHWAKLGKFRERHIAIGAGAHNMLNESPYTFVREYNRNGIYDKVVCAIDVQGHTTLAVPFPDGTRIRDAYSGQTGTVANGTISFRAQGLLLLEAIGPIAAPPAIYFATIDQDVHKEGYHIKLHTPHPKAKIYYTFDGSTPDMHAHPYKGDITLAKTTLVKAIACADGLCSQPIERTFFIESPGIKIHFYRPDSWGNAVPNIYFWNATPQAKSVEWPGVAMHHDGHGWYSYTIEGAIASNIIFNAPGQPQSADLYRNRDGWYEDGKWHERKPHHKHTHAEFNVAITSKPGRKKVGIVYHIPEEGHVSIAVLDAAGHLYATLMQGEMQEVGKHVFSFEAQGLPMPGDYVLEITWEGQKITQSFHLE